MSVNPRPCHFYATTHSPTGPSRTTQQQQKTPPIKLGRENEKYISVKSNEMIYKLSLLNRRAPCSLITQRANFCPRRDPMSFARQNRFGNERILTRMRDLMSHMISQHEEWLRYCLILAPQMTNLGTSCTRLSSVDRNTLSHYTLTGRVSVPLP